MKKLLGIGLCISLNLLCYSQNLDLIVSTKGDSIACRIDSITETKIHFRCKIQDEWVTTFIQKEILANYEYDIINKRYYNFKSGSTYIKNVIKNPELKNWWINIGLGGGSSGGLSSSIGHSFQKNINLITLRYFNNSVLDIGKAPNLYTRDFGILYGICSKGEKVRVSVSAGLSVVGYNKNIYGKGWWFGFEAPKFEKENKYVTFGIPIEAQLILKPHKVGLGINISADINDSKSFYGLMLCLKFGPPFLTF